MTTTSPWAGLLPDQEEGTPFQAWPGCYDADPRVQQVSDTLWVIPDDAEGDFWQVERQDNGEWHASAPRRGHTNPAYWAGSTPEAAAACVIGAPQ